MLNLKGPYDVVCAAEAASKQKAAEIATLLEGSDEDIKQALALQNSLEDLQADYETKLALYDKLVKANTPSGVNQLFVPASQTPATPDEPKEKGAMKLSEFRKLSPKERMAFSKSGGKLED